MSSEGQEVEEIDDVELDQPEMFWAQTIKAGETQIDPPSMPGLWIRITSVCFGVEVNNGSRTVLLFKDEEGNESPVAILLQGKNETQQLNLLINSPFTLVLKGRNVSPVTLSGHLELPPPDLQEMDDEDLAQMENDEEMENLLRKRALKEAIEIESDENEGDSSENIEEAKDRSSPTEPPLKKFKKGNNQPKGKQQSPKQKPKSGPTQAPKEPSKDSPKQIPSENENKNNKQNKGKKNKEKKTVVMKNGIEFKDIKVGSGPHIRNGQSVTVYYVGQLDDKTVFDKQISGNGFTFKFGKNEAIKGWDLGLKGMQVGGKRRLKIPAKFGYGNEGKDGIPPNSALTFTVEVKSAKFEN